MVNFQKLVLLASSFSAARAAFGFNATDSRSVTVDTGADVTFTVSKTTGDITSLKYKGVNYQSTAKFSHINSGLGTSNVTWSLVPDATGTNRYVKVQIKSTTLPVTHYYIVKDGDNTLYMATENRGEVNPGELRMLFRLNRTLLPLGPVAFGVEVSEISPNGTAIEGSDVYVRDNATRSKFYSSERFIDDHVHGVTGDNVGLWIVLPGTAYETSASGPFMRDINSQEADQHELYWYMNSGHLRTEPWRKGLQGPYAAVFTDGEKPDHNIDTSFFSDLAIPGYVPESGRGYVSGLTRGVDGTSVPGEDRSAKAAAKKPAAASPAVNNYWTRVDSTWETVVHWFNADAQYWTKSVAGAYKSPAMKPGTYTVKMYRNEFPIYTGSVTVTAGSTAVQNLYSTEVQAPTIWKVGRFDGQPFELKNGDKFLRMHPSDDRMDSWEGTYTVEHSVDHDFPMAAFKGVNTPKIVFSVASIEPNTTSPVLRVGTTLAFNGGRPSVTFNNKTLPAPPAPVKIDSRGITRGGYRGYGEVYGITIPIELIVPGENVISFAVASGSSGTGYLAPSFIFDAVQLEGTGIILGVPPVEEETSAVESETEVEAVPTA